MEKGLRTFKGAMACPPYTNGPYTWDQHVTFSGGISGLDGKGSVWYVSSASGVDGNDGKSWSSAKLTIQNAVTSASAGDVIYIQGTFTEAVTCSKDSISFIGAGPTVNDNVWMEGETPGITLMTLTGKNCRFENIRFRVPTTGGIGINMSGADYTVIQGCYFQGRAGSLQAILNNGGSSCKIIGNVFAYMNTSTVGAAILGVTYTAIPAGWEIAYNTFHSNLKHISMTMRQSYVHDNMLQSIGLSATNTALTATVMCDVYTGSAGNGQYNTVTGNNMQGDYSITGGYKSATSDDWYGNHASDVASTGNVALDGTTFGIPA